MAVYVDIIEPYPIDFENDRHGALEKYTRHIKADLHLKGVDSQVEIISSNRLLIKTTLPLENKDMIARHIKGLMYNVGVNVSTC